MCGRHFASRILAVTALLASVLAAAASPWANTAMACTPPPGGLPLTTLADRVAAAEMTIEGTVFSVEDDFTLQTAVIRVTHYITGSGPAVVTVSNFGPGSLCKSGVTPGQHALFFVEELDDGSLAAFYLTQFDATASADEANLADAIEAAGHPPARPDTTTFAFATFLSRDSGLESLEAIAPSSHSSPSTAAISLASTLVALAAVSGVAFTLHRHPNLYITR